MYSGATSIVTALIDAMSGGLVSAGSKGTLAELSSPTGVLNSAASSFISDPNKPYTSTIPKAYLNWMVLDEEQFKLVQGSYGAVQIVYNWFDYLKSKNHFVKGHVIMPNHIHLLIDFQVLRKVLIPS